MARDPDLVQRLKRGEPLALDQFYRTYAPQVLGWAIRLGGPSLDAEDIAQDVFATALRKIGRFRGDSALSTWLYVVTRNLIYNRRRRAAIRRFVGIDDGMDSLPDLFTPGADEQLEGLRRRRLVQRALQRLSDSHREVIVLMDMEGRTAPEVAEMISVPEGTCYSRLYHARRGFKAALQAEGVSTAEEAGLATATGEF